MKYIYFQWIRLLKNKIAAELRDITNGINILKTTFGQLMNDVIESKKDMIESKKDSLKG